METQKHDLMDDKICLITGGTGGIGKETAVGLARLGATVVIVSRNRDRGKAAVEEIRRRSQNHRVGMLLADLASLEQVRDLATAFRAEYPALHVLINNAGAIFSPRAETPDGYEMTFAVNHLSHFLLTHLLLDMLKASAPSRIVNVASGAHFGARIHFDDLMLTRSYRPFEAYRQSKLANILFTYELARRLEGTGVTANCLHPGVVATGFGRNTGWFFRNLVKVGAFLLSTPEEGARTSIYVASSPTLERISGKYFDRCREKRSSRASYDEEAARRLWEVSEKLVGISGGA